MLRLQESVSSPKLNPIRTFLTGFLFVFPVLLVLAPVVLLLRCSYFDPYPSRRLFPFILLLGCASFGSHFLGAFRSAWKSFPCWPDGLSAWRIHNLLSLPSFITAVILIFYTDWPVIYPLILLLLDLTARLTAVRFGEHTARFFLGTQRRPPVLHLAGAASPANGPDQISVIPFPLSGNAGKSSSDRFTPELSDNIRLDTYDSEPIEEETYEDEPEIPGELLSTQNRYQNPDGTERIEGWFRPCFQRGETISVVHLSFCPPLSKRPNLQLIQISGEETQIKPAMVEPFGARILVQRPSQPGSSEPDSSVRICFFAGESEQKEGV